MGLGIFRRAFVVRRFGEENIVDGYGVSGYKDFITSLNVQPLSKDELQALPEGENTVKRMKAFGDLVFHTADRSAGRRADWLFYQGRMDPEGHWYECVTRWWVTAAASLFRFQQQRPTVCRALKSEQMGKAGIAAYDACRTEEAACAAHPNVLCRSNRDVCQAELCSKARQSTGHADHRLRQPVEKPAGQNH